METWKGYVSCTALLALHLWLTGTLLVSTDRLLGNKIGWAKGFNPKTHDEGTATHVYASFEPSLNGMGCTLRENATM